MTPARVLLSKTIRVWRMPPDRSSRTRERRLAHASECGRDAMASAESGPACEPVRQLLHAA